MLFYQLTTFSGDYSAANCYGLLLSIFCCHAYSSECYSDPNIWSFQLHSLYPTFYADVC